ncbi:16S rRNA (guanine(966)-N(2))-methyltransferase RsmD [Pseudoclavibacter sp. JSM 162008]|uniref:16S rRNA (guanine(966)-N(2))-methyltransferase RsmD n=1 Tax=Pseudoclavibacter sp. JSM 162008 TaxID=3229855 RepID=UPI00352435F1
MTRIIAGAARGHSLSVPKSGTRPTSDRVREAMFSSLESLLDLGGVAVLDLYAGSGALAFEALSRGASSAVLVEQSKAATAVLRANAELLARVTREQGRRTVTTRVAQSSVSSFLRTPPAQRFELVFIDPPYELGEAELSEALEALVPHLAPEAVVVIERGSRSPAPTGPHSFDPLRRKAYGETIVYSYEAVPVEESDAEKSQA